MSSLALAPADHLAVMAEPEPDRRLTLPIEQRPADLAARHAALRPWRAASIREALGIPAIFQAVNLIANTVGTFTLDAYLNGLIVPPEQRPRLLIRPNPFTTLREFLRETAHSMASVGEAWWWVAARDGDGLPLSLIPVPAREIRIQGTDWLRTRTLWRGQDRTEDLVHLVLSKEVGATRGVGPLQLCGAAVSAAVESQEWAANFYALGGNPNVVIKSEIDLTKDEAQTLKEQWTLTPPNMPQVVSGPTDVTEFGTNEAAAQMLEARNWNAGEAARMFSIPGPLLEYSRGGSSLTYQNISALMDQLLRQCLLPNYLEPMEQALTDMLPRSWASQFNADAALRADVKTRYEVYKLGFEAGLPWISDVAAQAEGIVAGSVETAPVPFAPPAAFPAGIPPRFFSLPEASRGEWRCDNCDRKLAEVRGVGAQMRCRCGALAIA